MKFLIFNMIQNPLTKILVIVYNFLKLNIDIFWFSPVINKSIKSFDVYDNTICVTAHTVVFKFQEVVQFFLRKNKLVLLYTSRFLTVFSSCHTFN